MRPFLFRLETLLKYRKMQETQTQIKFSQVAELYKRALELSTQLENKRLTTMEALRQGQLKGFTIEVFKFNQNYIDKLNVDIDKQLQVVVKTDEYRLECLGILQEAMKKRKLAEKLREKRFAQYQVGVLQEEQKLLDETGLQIFTREKSGVTE